MSNTGVILPASLDEAARTSEFFQAEKAVQQSYTSCVFIALSRSGGDSILVVKLAHKIGFMMTGGGFA